MMLKMVYVEGRYCPQFFCDACRGRIEDAARAHYLWYVPPDTMHPADGDIAHVHKECDRPFTQTRGGQGHWNWGLLQDLLIYLGRNVQFDRRAAEQHLNELAQIGL